MSKIINTAALSIILSDAKVRAAVTDTLNGLTAGPAGHLTLASGQHDRAVVYSGPLPGGVDKALRAILNPDGGTTYKVSTVRNLPHQETLWATLKAEKDVKAEYTPKAKPAKPAKPDKASDKATPPAVTPTAK